jgi:outer membrane receptor for ferrienterochelin and colicin
MNNIFFNLLLSFILGTFPVFAVTGIVEGSVTDAVTGQPLPGANIILKNMDLGAAADQSGFYVIENVPAGVYIIQASMIGYEDRVTADQPVEANRVTRIDFEMRECVIVTESVAITGSYFERSSDAVSSSHTLSSREIRSSPGAAEDVFRILKTIPGVSTTGSNSANLIVRGGDRNENLTLLENLEIKSPLHFSREDVSMGVISIIDPAMIKNVEFLTGGFPAEYGDKLSSVFELKVKEGNRSQFNRDINASMAGFNVYLDGPLPGNGGLVLSVRRGIFELFTKMMDRAVEPCYWDGLAKASWDLNRRHRISVVGFYYKDDAERQEKMEDHGILARKYDYSNWNDYGSAAGMNWRALLGKNAYALTTLEWTQNGNQSMVGTFTNKDLNGDDIQTTRWQLKSRVSWKPSPFIMIKGGAYIKQFTADYTRWRDADTLRTGIIIPAFNRIATLPVSYQSGAFIQAAVQPLPLIVFKPGIRYDMTDLTHENYFSPRLAMVCRLTDRVTLNASWGVYRQIPSALQICRDDENLLLKSSRSDHTVIGLEYMMNPDTRMTLEAYTKIIQDGFVDNDTTNVIHNDGKGSSKGVEFTIQKKMSTNFMGSLSYTTSFSERQDGKNRPVYAFDYDRRHNLTLMAAHQLTRHWRLGVKFQFASGNPYTPVTGSTNAYGEWFAVEGEKNTARFPDYHSLDIRLDRTFRFTNWTMNIYLEIWNLYNRENVLDYYYVFEADGTPIQKSAADFPRMPMLGISVQF